METDRPPPRVFVLEDDPDTRRKLSDDVSFDGRLRLAAAVGSLSEAIRWWESGQRAEVALVDLGLPDGNGIDFIRAIGDSPNPPAILVITALGDEKHVIDAIAAGATGYLLKERDPAHVADSILTVLQGGSPVSPSIARHLLKRFRQPLPEHEAAAILTRREEDVLRLVVKGYSYKEIATALELSVHTVTSHIQHIYRKLSVRSRGEAVFEAIQLGLVDPRS